MASQKALMIYNLTSVRNCQCWLKFLFLVKRCIHCFRQFIQNEFSKASLFEAPLKGIQASKPRPCKDNRPWHVPSLFGKEKQ